MNFSLSVFLGFLALHGAVAWIHYSSEWNKGYFSGGDVTSDDEDGSGNEPDLEASGDDESSGEPGPGTGVITPTLNCPQANGWVERNGECYWFSDHTLHYEHALRVCHNHASSLYSPTSYTDLSWLVEEWQTKRGDESMAWIGCSDRRNEGVWDCDGTAFDYTAWGYGEPSNDPHQHCMVTFINPWWAGFGQEFDNECSLYELPFVCKAGCPDKPNWVSYKGNCYYFSEKALNYADAEQYCHTRGLKVFSPDNDEEQQFLLEQFHTYGGIHSMAYIGCDDRDVPGYWRCDDGHGAVANHFGVGDPSHTPGEDCVVTFINRGWAGYGDWWDNPCDLELPFVCSYW